MNQDLYEKKVAARRDALRGDTARRDALRGAKRMSKPTVGGAVATLAVLFLVGIAVAGVIGGLLLMTATALIHRDIAAVPALGFVSSFGVMLALSTISAALRGVTANAKV